MPPILCLKFESTSSNFNNFVAGYAPNRNKADAVAFGNGLHKHTSINAPHSICLDIQCVSTRTLHSGKYFELAIGFKCIGSSHFYASAKLNAKPSSNDLAPKLGVGRLLCDGNTRKEQNENDEAEYAHGLTANV